MIDIIPLESIKIKANKPKTNKNFLLANVLWYLSFYLTITKYKKFHFIFWIFLLAKQLCKGGSIDSTPACCPRSSFYHLLSCTHQNSYFISLKMNKSLINSSIKLDFSYSNFKLRCWIMASLCMQFGNRWESTKHW